MNVPTPTPEKPPDLAPLALVLVGGGARAAYQAGFLRGLIRRHPDLQLPIITGTSAGAINAAYLASQVRPLDEAIEDLVHLWRNQRVDHVFRVDTVSLISNMIRWGMRLVSGGGGLAPQVAGLLDTTPLRRFLHDTLQPAANGEITGISRNVADGRLHALALATSSYSTGQSMIWIQGADIADWERPHRISRKTTITVEHIMASAAIPLFFPPVQLDDGWYGDGGIRMTDPCSPAIHLGARRILAISNRYRGSAAEARRSVIDTTPPPAQIGGQLLNAIFLDDLDRDGINVQRLNGLLAQLPPGVQHELQPIDLVVIRPSEDLGRLSRDFEPKLPRLFRHLTRSLGSRETASPDLLSLLMFQPDYIGRLLEIGEGDAERDGDRVAALLHNA